MSTNMDIQTIPATSSAITSASQAKTINGPKNVVSTGSFTGSSNIIEIETVDAGGKELPQAGLNVAQVVELPSREDFSQAIKNLNNYTQNLQRQLNFSIDEVTGHMVIKVIDAETQETIRQIPAEEVLVLAREMQKSEEIGDMPGEKKGVFLEVMV